MGIQFKHEIFRFFCVQISNMLFFLQLRDVNVMCRRVFPRVFHNPAALLLRGVQLPVGLTLAVYSINTSNGLKL